MTSEVKSVDASIHKALCDLLQRVYEEHGIQVNSVYVGWRYRGGFGNQALYVGTVEVASEAEVGALRL